MRGPVDVDLSIIAETNRLDGILMSLIGLADVTAARYGVGLLTNGMTIYGAVASARIAAQAVDDLNQALVARWREQSSEKEGWDDAEERVRGFALQRWEQERERAESVRLHIEATREGEDLIDPVQLPEELQRPFVQRQVRPILTLADAKVCAPGQTEPPEIPVLRVRVSQVSAWWLLAVDAPIEHPR